MTDPAQLIKLWTILSHKVLASVLTDDGAILAIQDIVGGHAEWFPPKDRPIWRAIQGCLEANVPPTLEAVTQRLAEPNGYVKTVAGLFNEDDNRRLVYNTEQLRGIGVLSEVWRSGQYLQELSEPDEVEGEIGRITNDLGGLLAKKSNRKPDAVTVSDAAWETVTQQDGSGIPTGLKWFDEVMGGMWPGMNYVMPAPYKSGKTTLCRNILLTAAKAGHPVGMFCAEGSRELFALDCQAMLATEILFKDDPDGTHRLSGLFIKRYYWRQGIFTAPELDATNKARDIWNELPIEIWDTKDGIRDLVTLRYLIKRAKMTNGTQVFWGDYLGLFGEGEIFKRTETVAHTIEEIAVNDNVFFGMLAQQNEEQIRSSGRSHSPGIKGGGDPAAAADCVLIPSIDRDKPNYLNVLLKLSRHSPDGIENSHKVIPACGLLLDKFGRVKSHI